MSEHHWGVAEELVTFLDLTMGIEIGGDGLQRWVEAWTAASRDGSHSPAALPIDIDPFASI